MNKWIRLGLISVTSLVLVLSGCAQQNQASAPELEKPKEPTVSEVLQKSANMMSKGGYAYDLDLDFSFAFTAQGVQTTIPVGSL